jgi:ADP-ribosylglycohydrolase
MTLEPSESDAPTVTGASDCTVRDRVRASILGAFAADAASMGTHWIFDPDRLVDTVGKSWELRPEYRPQPPAPEFYSSVEYPGHYGPGQLSPYGEQLEFVTNYCRDLMVDHGGGPLSIDPRHMTEAFKDWAESFGGRKDHALSLVLEKIERHERGEDCYSYSSDKPNDAEDEEHADDESLGTSMDAGGTDEDRTADKVDGPPSDEDISYRSDSTDTFEDHNSGIDADHSSTPEDHNSDSDTNHSSMPDLVNRDMEDKNCFGVRDDHAHAYMKALPVTWAMVVERDSPASSSLSDLTTAIRVHQQSDVAVVFGCASGVLLQCMLEAKTLEQALEHTNQWAKNQTDNRFAVVVKAFADAKEHVAARSTRGNALKLELVLQNLGSPSLVRSSKLPAAFIVPLILLYRLVQARKFLTEQHYKKILRQNIQLAGDTCSRAILLGSVLAAGVGSVPESFLAPMEPTLRARIEETANAFAGGLSQ